MKEETGSIIGTLSEKNVHATLKKLIEPDENFHEVKFRRFVCDIKRENEIFEIQTKQFFRLRRKLEVFLPDCRVTAVHPIPHIKYICWIDPETGTVSEKRKSPKVGSAFDLFYELDGIRDLIRNPNLSFRVYLIDMTEYRVLDGWSRDKKRGSHRAERIPEGIFAQMDLKSPESFSALLPETLPEPFTVKELAKCAKITRDCASRAVRCLCEAGAIARDGNRGREYLYRKIGL